MSYIPRSSFIPQEASGAIPMQMKKRRTIHVFSFIATLMLFGALLASGATFFYNDFLRKNLASAQGELNEVSKLSNEEKIEEIRTYDNKLNIATSLLDNHISASMIFEELENSTKDTVQFDTLSFMYDPGFEATLTLTGNTEEFSSVALQKMQFLEDSLFSTFVLEDVSVSNETDESSQDPDAIEIKKGKVSFSVTGHFKKGILDYSGQSVKKASTPTTLVFPSEVSTNPGTGQESSTATSSVASSTNNQTTP